MRQQFSHVGLCRSVAKSALWFVFLRSRSCPVTSDAVSRVGLQLGLQTGSGSNGPSASLHGSVSCLSVYLEVLKDARKWCVRKTAEMRAARGRVEEPT